MAKKVLIDAEVVQEEHVADWREHKDVRAIGRGFANNRLYEVDDIVPSIVIDHNRTLPSWLKLKGDGEPVDGPNSLKNAVDFAKEEKPRVKQGFAAGIAPE